MTTRPSQHLHCFINGCPRCFFARGVCVCNTFDKDPKTTPLPTAHHSILSHRAHAGFCMSQRTSGILSLFQRLTTINQGATITSKSRGGEAHRLYSVKNKAEQFSADECYLTLQKCIYIYIYIKSFHILTRMTRIPIYSVSVFTHMQI